MNSRYDPPPRPEPLSPEERVWAERLNRLGPHDGPPPALDARILAAAHAAVAQRPRHRRSPPLRWPTLVGAAASLVIVVGLAWQLQPLLRTRPSLGEQPSAAAAAPSSEGALSEDVLAAANPVAQSAVNSPPPAPTVAKTGRARAAPRPPMAQTPGPAPSPESRSDFGDDAIPPYADYAGHAPTRQASRAAANRAAAPAPIADRRERTTTGTPEPFPAAADAADMAAMSAPAPTQTGEASARSPAGSFAPPSAPAQKPAAQTGTAAAEQDNRTLDRVEVSGSRIRMAELPVRDDARLDPAAWLQRIRERRDGNDLDGARASLALFRRSHPRIRVPDDLAHLGR